MLCQASDSIDISDIFRNIELVLGEIKLYEVQLIESLFPAQTDDVVREITIGELLSETSARCPASTALVEVDLEGKTGRRWTYAELETDSVRLALALSSRFEQGERVTVWAPNIPEWLVMEYACALSGIILVTANPAYQAKELRYILEQSGSVALFLVNEYRGNPMAEIAAEATKGLATFREIVDLEDEAALFQCGTRSANLPEIKPDDAAQIQYTSGTTGFPKGAVLAHRSLVNNARFYANRAGINPDSVWVNMMPMFHTAGCGMVALGCMQAGCKMLMIKKFDAAVVCHLIDREKVTMLNGVPTMLVAILEYLGHNSVDVDSVKMVSLGGSMVAPDLVENIKRVFGCDYETVYGQTETSPLVTQHHHNDTMEDLCNTIGQPLPQTSISIRSVGENQIVPVDTVGEICVKGYCNMIGYNGNEQATAETIDPEGWLHTGDLGTVDPRGYFRITGRVKDMIIRGGENMFPVEIENVLLEHPSVAEVAVVGLPDDKWGEIIACFVRPETGKSIERQSLHDHCRKNLSPQKTPVIWCSMEAFPMTGSGKIRKFVLRDNYLAGDYPEMN